MGGLGRWRGHLRVCGTWAALACLAAGAAGQTRPDAPRREVAAMASRVRIADDRTGGYVRRALANARARLTDPVCRQLLSEFADPSGRPLQDSLDALQQQP